MRRLMLVFLLLAALPAAAQKPAGLQPLPDVPPPPPGVSDASLEPQVTIIQKGETKEEQYRINGQLYMIKVTPPHGGTPYYLIDSRGDGTFSRQESMDSGIRVPMWVIGNF
ncbi:MAG: DUF2782 domain-containing protein [Ignavibacteria bacterium]